MGSLFFRTSARVRWSDPRPAHGASLITQTRTLFGRGSTLFSSSDRLFCRNNTLFGRNSLLFLPTNARVR
jgi:hypothetical protein